ncbi:SDR family NAD(P)-dependent oxidoreductase [Antarctobacter sp.]|uniref:SDR family NAD(P)-dependent oxidoreductase n=1 Tax=Antarctobacter sp. TaxID=1872577 RepID=UPI003A9395D6
MGEFAGKQALVVGGGSGIGAECIRLLAGQGAAIVVADRDQDAAERVAAEHGGRAEAYDISDPAAASDLVARLEMDSCLPDVLINCAGIREIAHPLDLTPEQWQQVLAVNLSGAFYIAQAVARKWRDDARPGAIVIAASTSGLLASENRAAYVASKHGVVGLTKQLALDLGPLGIRVNAVAPGVVRTPMTESYFDDPETVERLNRVYPLGRVALPVDVAEVMVFLASDRARHVTGTVVPVDAGYTAGRRK